MDKLLHFMDFSCIDAKMYWRIPSRTGQDLYEIQWQRESSPRWRLRKLGSLFWDLATETSLATALEAREIDTELFEAKLKASLLQQVSYAHRIVADARSLFGIEEVDAAVQEQGDFLKQLEQVVTQLTSLPTLARPKLRVISSLEKNLYN